MAVTGWLALLVGLLVSVALHEVGHMVPAKRFGVRVSQFMVGFGPTLWSRQRGETEYGIKGILLGGYVRLIGMFPPAEVTGARPRPGRMGEIVQATRDASAEEVRPGEEHRAFYRLSTPKKVVVMLGGPVMNLVIATVLFAVILVGFGIPVATTTVESVGECLLPADAPADQACTADDPPVPVAVAGLQPGDVLVGYGGHEVSTWGEFTEAVRSAEVGEVPLEVERDGERLTLTVTPVLRDRPAYDEQGVPVLDAEGEQVIRPTPYLGVGPSSVYESQPLSSVAPVVGSTVVGTLEVVFSLPQKLWEVAQAAFGVRERDASSVMGVVGLGRIAGEVTSGDASVRDQVSQILFYIASLNIALFAFNLLPLLPLDGGHVVAALWEGAKRQVARLRGAPRPAPVDVARMMPVAYVVVAVFVGMTALLLYADIVAPVTFG
jgi:membrane-associated protease RseP (regulator of RpoE activity)